MISPQGNLSRLRGRGTARSVVEGGAARTNEVGVWGLFRSEHVSYLFACRAAGKLVVKKWKFVAGAAVVASFAVGMDYSVAALRAKSSPDYLLFADGLVSASIRGAVTAGPPADVSSVGSQTECLAPPSSVAWNSELGPVVRTLKWGHFPFIGTSLEVAYELPKSGYTERIVTRIESAFAGENSFGDAEVFVKGLIAGSVPQLKMLRCSNHDVLTITKAY